MALLYLVLTHRPADEVARHLAALDRALPGRRFGVLYGGTREEFERVATPAKAFVDDPSLRGEREQSYAELLRVAFEAFVAGDPGVSLVHLIEHDHAIVDERYEAEVLRALELTGGDYLGAICVDRTHTNWIHSVRLVDDDELWRFLEKVGVRDDEPEPRLFGGIANAITIRRAALEAFARLPRHLERYCEVYVPTVLHHLGFTIGDASSVTAVFDRVRWTPPYEAEEIAALPGDVLAVHPVKDYDLLDLVVRRAG